jgi:hypothetical protein
MNSQQILDQAALMAVQMIEKTVDEQIERMDHMGEDELAQIRRKRLAEMAALQKEKQEWRRNDHGMLMEIADEREFFATTKASKRVVCHFMRKTNPFCLELNEHLRRVAQRHQETKFVYLDAERTPFLVEKLKIWMLPTIALILDGKVKDYVVGLDEVGGEEMQTGYLEGRLLNAMVIFENEDGQDNSYAPGNDSDSD